MTNQGPVRVGFVGASTVSFGAPGVPWDHATRLERIGNIQVVGIADPDTAKADKLLTNRQAGNHGNMYTDCKLYSCLEAMLEDTKLHAIILATGPLHRGSLVPGKDIELTCVKAGIPLFVEKPLSVVPMEEFKGYVAAVEKAQQEKNVVVSVGYMFRYHDAVRKMRELIEAHGAPVRAISLWYYFAYSETRRPFLLWDSRRNGGPIVEQATHMVDLARYLCGEVVPGSVQTICQRASDPGAHLSQLPTGFDDELPEDARIPRATMATWRFQCGTIGSLTHVIALHGKKYEAYMDVLLDGMRIRWLDPYGPTSRLEVRGLGEDPEEEQVLHFGDSDPYEGELRAFIEAVRTGDQTIIASSYSDATRTYQLTRDIISVAK